MSAPLQSEIRLHNGRPTLFLNGEIEAPIFYALTDVPGGRWSWEELPAHNIRQFLTRGFRLVQLDIALDDVWFEDGSFSVETARRQIRGVTEIRADAAVMFRLHVRPPRWWMARNPDENTLYLNAQGEICAGEDDAPGFHRHIEDDARRPRRTSLASQKWLDECGPIVARFCRELAQTPEGDALMGVQIAGGVFGEWHYWGFIEHEVDVSAPMQARFAAWQREKYGENREILPVPAWEIRVQTGDGLFRSPQNSGDVWAMDYARCQHECVAHAIEFFARVVKENWPREVVVGAFYGYFFSCFGRDIAGGHLEIARLLRSPHLDFFCGPSTYYPDAWHPGEWFRSRGLLESCRLNGKLWLDEMDQQNQLPGYWENDYHEHIAASRAKTVRNLSFAPLKGHGLWFYDFGPSGFSDSRGRVPTHHGSQGWWDDPHLLRDIAAVKCLLESRSQNYESAADVLVVGDPQTHYAMASVPRNVDAVSHAAIGWTPLGLMQAGTVFDAIYLCDLERVAWENYRVVVFLNAFVLSQKQREFIAQNVAQGGRQIVWIYAPAYSDGSQNCEEFVRQTTGFELKKWQSATRVEISAPFGNYGLSETPISPIFHVCDGAAQPLAHFSGGEVAWARKQFETHEAFFIALPAFDAALGKCVAELTDAHRFSRSADVIYADAQTILLHSREGGERAVFLKSGREIRVRMPHSPATALLDAQSGEVLFLTPQ